MRSKPRYRLAALAYPAEYRRRHFDELLDTATQLSSEKWSIRQGASLLTHGVRTRSRLATGASPTNIWKSGVRLNVILTLLIGLTFDLGGWHGVLPVSQARWITLLSAAAVVALIAHPGRFAAALYSTFIGASILLQIFHGRLFNPSGGVGEVAYVVGSMTVVALSVAGVWWVASGSRPAFTFGPAAYGAAATVGLLLVLSQVIARYGYDGMIAAQYVFYFTASAVAVLAGWLDPRLAAAVALQWSQLAFLTGSGLLLLVDQTLRPDILLALLPAVLAALAFVLTRWSSKRLELV